MERYVIHVTKECNMECKYCYEKDKTSKYTWKEVKELLDNIIKYNKDKEFEIEYLGGEPLLAFNIIKKATEYLESQRTVKIRSYAITTNGTVLNKEIIEWLRNNKKVYWFASMDGTKWMNQLRVFKKSGINSHDIVLKNYKILEKEIGNNRIGVHMVTHPYNIAYLSQGIKHLYENGVRNIGVGTVESTIIIDDEYCNRFVEELNNISMNICNGIYNDLNIDVLSYLKPKSDTRYYIKDETGKTIAESYGRTKNDITKTDVYNSIPTQSRVGNMIEDIREKVYYNHQINLKNRR
ncbi:radical SAM protein [Clostridium sp. LBM24168]